MANQISPQLFAQIFAQESGDPYLVLLTMTHDSFEAPVRLVNDSVDCISRGQRFESFPFKITLGVEDGETVPEVGLEMDNVSLELVAKIRSVTDAIDVKLEMILASIPNDVQMVQDDLQIQSIQYTATKISAKVILDNFLNTDMTSERYVPLSYPGLF